MLHVIAKLRQCNSEISLCADKSSGPRSQSRTKLPLPKRKGKERKKWQCSAVLQTLVGVGGQHYSQAVGRLSSRRLWEPPSFHPSMPHSPARIVILSICRESSALLSSPLSLTPSLRTLIGDAKLAAEEKGCQIASNKSSAHFMIHSTILELQCSVVVTGFRLNY